MPSDKHVLLRLHRSLQAAQDDARYLAAHRRYEWAEAVELVLVAAVRLARRLAAEHAQRLTRARQDQEG